MKSEMGEMGEMQIGETIGDYRIEAKLGEGGVGEVLLATDTLLARPVALKRLRSDLANSDTVVERFHVEARTLAQLNHPNIATLYGLERDRDGILMVMEYIEGQTLSTLMRRHGRLALPSVMDIMKQALAGLAYVHEQGIVHRDIKGSNLMLDRHGVLKIMDFGIARVVGSERSTRMGQVVGTPEFVSPEQIRGEAPDARSDLYSLGILFVWLLTGRMPFNARGEYALLNAHVETKPLLPSELDPELPAAFDPHIEQALAKDPGERFARAEDFRDALVAAAEPLLGKATARPPSLASLLTAPEQADGEGAEVLADTARWLTAVPLQTKGLAAAASRAGGEAGGSGLAVVRWGRRIAGDPSASGSSRRWAARAAALVAFAVLLAGINLLVFGVRGPGQSSAASAESARETGGEVASSPRAVAKSAHAQHNPAEPRAAVAGTDRVRRRASRGEGVGEGVGAGRGEAGGGIGGGAADRTRKAGGQGSKKTTDDPAADAGSSTWKIVR